MDVSQFLTVQDFTFVYPNQSFLPAPPTYFFQGSLPDVSELSNGVEVLVRNTCVLYDSVNPTVNPDGLYGAVITWNPTTQHNDYTWQFTLPMAQVFDVILNKRSITAYFGQTVWPTQPFDRDNVLYYPALYEDRDPAKPVVYENMKSRVKESYDATVIKATSGTVHGYAVSFGTSFQGQFPLIVIDNTGATSGVTFELPLVGIGPRNLIVRGKLLSNLTVTVPPADVSNGTKIDGSLTSQTIANSALGFDFAKYFTDGVQWWRIG